ncbi:MAG: ABC transporter permease [Lactobacillus sp.]
MLALCRRNLLLYFKNKAGLFFSLLGAMISLVLYVIFLKKSMLDSWAAVPHSRQLLDLWLIGGTLSVTGITTTLTALGQLAKDREQQVIKDFMLTDLSRFEIKVSYLLSASLIGFLMQVVMFVIMVGYFGMSDQLSLDTSKLVAILGIAALGALLSVTGNMLIVEFVHRIDTLGTIGTIVGTATGFLVGTYIPIGVLPTFAQTLIKLTPGAYLASLYRQVMMDQQLAQAFPARAARQHFERLMGVRLDWGHLLSTTGTLQIIILMVLAGILLLFVTELVQQRRHSLPPKNE